MAADKTLLKNAKGGGNYKHPTAQKAAEPWERRAPARLLHLQSSGCLSRQAGAWRSRNLYPTIEHDKWYLSYFLLPKTTLKHYILFDLPAPLFHTT